MELELLVLAEDAGVLEEDTTELDEVPPQAAKPAANRAVATT